MLESIKNLFFQTSNDEGYFELLYWSQIMSTFIDKAHYAAIEVFFWIYNVGILNWFPVTMNVIPFSVYVIHSEIVKRSLHNKNVELSKKIVKLRRIVKSKRHIAKSDKECNTTISKKGSKFIKTYRQLIRNPWSNSHLKSQNKTKRRFKLCDSCDSDMYLDSELPVKRRDMRKEFHAYFLPKTNHKLNGIIKNEKGDDIYEFYGHEINLKFLTHHEKDANGNILRGIPPKGAPLQNVDLQTLNEGRQTYVSIKRSQVYREEIQMVIATKQKESSILKQKQSHPKVTKSSSTLSESRMSLDEKKKNPDNSTMKNSQHDEKLKKETKGKEKQQHSNSVRVRIQKKRELHEENLRKAIEEKAKKEALKEEKDREEREKRLAEIKKLRGKTKKKKINVKTCKKSSSKSIGAKPIIKKANLKLNKTAIKTGDAPKQHTKPPVKKNDLLAKRCTRKAKSEPNLLKPFLDIQESSKTHHKGEGNRIPEKEDIDTSQQIPNEGFQGEVDHVEEVIKELIKRNRDQNLSSRGENPSQDDAREEKKEMPVTNSLSNERKSRTKMTVTKQVSNDVPHLSFRKSVVSTSRPSFADRNIKLEQTTQEKSEIAEQKKTLASPKSPKKGFIEPKLNNAARLRCLHNTRTPSLPSTPRQKFTVDKSYSAPTSPRLINFFKNSKIPV